MVRGGGSLLSKLKNLVLHKKEAITSLPDDLYLEIFIRLPVKSTFTCKCVSKTWFSIISSRDFVNLHLNHTLKFENNSRFILNGYDRKIKASQIYIITKHSLFSTSKFYGKALPMGHQPFKSAKLVGIWGSCNGLVCLLHRKNFTVFVSLWNPATKEYKRIPDSLYLTVYRPGYFCYDDKNDDYKLVYAVTSRDHTPSFSLYVYNLRSDLWKTHPTKPYYVESLDRVLLNGALHWICITSRVIVSFNIREESFQEIQLPGEILQSFFSSRLFLRVLEGCLCVAPAVYYKAWVMREYGVWESWTEIQSKFADDYKKDLKWFSQNGECLIYSQDTDLVLYDLKHSSDRRLKLGSLVIRDVDNYVETLVSLNTGTYVGREEVTGTPRRGIWRKWSVSY